MDTNEKSLVVSLELLETLGVDAKIIRAYKKHYGQKAFEIPKFMRLKKLRAAHKVTVVVKYLSSLRVEDCFFRETVYDSFRRAYDKEV